MGQASRPAGQRERDVFCVRLYLCPLEEGVGVAVATVEVEEVLQQFSSVNHPQPLLQEGAGGLG